jgi:hypothetical protein
LERSVGLIICNPTSKEIYRDVTTLKLVNKAPPSYLLVLTVNGEVANNVTGRTERQHPMIVDLRFLAANWEILRDVVDESEFDGVNVVLNVETTYFSKAKNSITH